MAFGDNIRNVILNSKKFKAEQAGREHQKNIADVGQQYGGFYKQQEEQAKAQGIQQRELNTPFSQFAAGRDYGTGEIGKAFGSTNLRDTTAAQTQYAQNQGQLNQQGAAEAFGQQNQAKFAAPTASQDYFRDFGGRANQASEATGVDASMNQYFDQARQQSASTINDQLAARGGFGSSAGLGMLMNAQTGINAAQSQQQGDFALRRAQAMDDARLRGLEVGGTLARSGDDSGVNMGRLGLDTARTAQEQQLNRLGMGQRAAEGVSAANLAAEQAYLNAAGNVTQTQMAQTENQRRDILEQRDYTNASLQGQNQRIAALQQAGIDATTAAQLGYSAEEIAGLKAAEAQSAANVQTAVSGGVGLAGALAPIFSNI